MGWKPVEIVVAVDGSEQSVTAARTAVDLARLTDGHVTMITVVRPPEGWWGLEGSPPSPEVLAEAIASSSRELLRISADLAADGVSVETVEELGDPASTILALCERIDADLLVIGKRGAGFVERMMLGSVADRLAHHAPCPVMIVP